jgi:hypothetical protein
MQKAMLTSLLYTTNINTLCQKNSFLLFANATFKKRPCLLNYKTWSYWN